MVEQSFRVSRSALIDNASLTAVQRLHGEIPVKNLDIVDSDILAQENLFQAILFYDEVYYFDDYKLEHRANREKYFNTLIPVSTEHESFKDLIDITNDLYAKCIHDVKAGVLEGDSFAPFLEMLKMHLVFSWNLSSSVYYLTLRILEKSRAVDIPKYGTLASMIFHELHDREYKGKIPDIPVTLIDSQGEIIDDNYMKVKNYGGTTKQFDAFFAGLNWMAFRTILYTLFAQQLGLDLFLHPVRQAFQVNFLGNMTSGNFFKYLAGVLNTKITQTVDMVVEPFKPIMIPTKLPIFSAWLASKNTDHKDYLDYVYHLRQEPLFVHARKQLDRLRGYLSLQRDKEAFREAHSICNDIRRTAEKILSTYGVSTRQGSPTSSWVTLLNTASATLELPKPSGFASILSQFKDFVPNYGFGGIYKTIITDLLCIERLGDYHEKITKHIRKDNEAEHYGIKTVQSKYQYASNNWTKPM